jgi:RNA polymerase sigma factor (sigma-70 family)
MPNSPVTRPTLLVRIRDACDQRAWSEFVELYSPLIYGFTRKQGLQDADAVDVTQDVLRIVSRSIGHLEYDPERGSFRGWLFTIVRNELKDWFTKQRSAAIGSGESANVTLFDSLSNSEDELSAVWNRDHEQHIFERAADRVRGEVEESTWQAFWKATVENQSGKQIAAELGLSVAAVYLAKSRVMARLKELVRVMND